MADVNEPIVSFTAPPVVEVVAGVAFDGVDAELGPLLGAFWKEQLRETFPVLEQQPPYSPPMEQFPISRSSADPFEISTTYPPARLWAKSVDGQQILQLQPGYFACNWRRVRPSDDYDRWPRRRNEFERWFSSLCEFLATEGTGQPKITQCEVTYINHIRGGGAWSDHSQFDKIFTLNLDVSNVGDFEQAIVQVDSVLKNEFGQPTGRLHLKILPAFARDGKTPLYVFELTARGAPRGDGLPGALSFLNEGRKAIDLAFVAATSPLMHREWGRQA